jgi:hypothetical protein
LAQQKNQKASAAQSGSYAPKAATGAGSGKDQTSDQQAIKPMNNEAEKKYRNSELENRNIQQQMEIKAQKNQTEYKYRSNQAEQKSVAAQAEAKWRKSEADNKVSRSAPQGNMQSVQVPAKTKAAPGQKPGPGR